MHDGLHQAIVDQELWDQVAQQLSSSRVQRRRPKNLASNRLLAGLLFSASGERYVPTHASKHGRRYFYYTCVNTKAAYARLPAAALEKLVLSRLGELLADCMALRELYRDLSVPELRLVVAAGEHAAERLRSAPSQTTQSLVQGVLARVQVADQRLCLQIGTPALLSKLLDRPCPAEREPLVLECPLEARGRGAEVRLVLEQQRSAPLPMLLIGVARGRDWARRILAGEIESLSELQEHAQLSRRYVQRILQCAALPPEEVEAMVTGDKQCRPFEALLSSVPRRAGSAT